VQLGRWFLVLILTFSVAWTAPLEKVRLQLQWKHQFEFAGFYAAKEQGYYQEAGFDVEFVEYNPSIDVIESVLDGTNTFGTTYSSLIAAYLQGKEVRFIANFFKHSPLAIATQPHIRLPSDLFGKRIEGIESELQSATILMMLRRFAMGLKDIEIVTPTFNIADFAAKKVDAMVVFVTNETYMLDKAEVPYHLIKPSNYGAEFYDVNLFCSKTYAVQSPERVRAFRDASIRGWEYALSHIDESVSLIERLYNSQSKSGEALRYEANQIKNIMLPTVYPIGSIDPRRVRMIAEEFEELGIVGAQEMNLEHFIFEDAKPQVALTQEEEAYIAQKGRVKLCVDPSWMPFEAIVEGKHIGIAADFFGLLSQKSKLAFELYPTTSWQESLDAAKNRACDLFSLASPTQERETYMRFTTDYVDLPIVLATDIYKPYTEDFGSLRGVKIGVVRGYAMAEILKKEHKGLSIVEVDNIMQALEMVQKGELYGYVDNLMVIAHTIQKEFTGVLKISSRLPHEIKLGVGVRNDDAILFSIMQKLVESVTEAQIQEIYNHWVTVQESVAADYTRMYQIFGVLGVLLLLFMLHYIQLRVYTRKLRTISRTDLLTQLVNRMGLDEKLNYFEGMATRYGTPTAVMIVDIDHFKQVNDTHGHAVGDRVLVEFATILRKTLRATDTVGRWGGEEFMVLCPNTSLSQAIVIAQNLREAIASHYFLGVGSLTASFGVAILDGATSIDDVTRHADDALYSAKAQGRNCVMSHT